MGHRVSFPEQWAYCCQTAFVLYVCFIRTLPSHHWVLQVLMVQWDLVLPVDRKEMWLEIFAHHHHSSLTNLCSPVSKQISFNKHWQVLSLYGYSIRFGLRSCHTPLFTGELRLNVFAASQRCFTYSCTIIPSCPFRSFLTNCSLNKHNKWKSFVTTLKRNVVMKKTKAKSTAKDYYNFCKDDHILTLSPLGPGGPEMPLSPGIPWRPGGPTSPKAPVGPGLPFSDKHQG